MQVSEIGGFIDFVIQQLQHSFFMVLFGIAFWFGLEWSTHMAARRKKRVTFWQDQKDEIYVTILGGMIFLVWDDETLNAIDFVKQVWFGDMLSEDWIPPNYELRPFMYLLVGPVVERMVWAYKKFKGGDK